MQRLQLRRSNANANYWQLLLRLLIAAALFPLGISFYNSAEEQSDLLLQQKQQQLTMPAVEFIDVSFFGEGMEYAPLIDKFLLGSLQFGTLLAVPRADFPYLWQQQEQHQQQQQRQQEPQHYDAKDIDWLIAKRPAVFGGSNFLGLQMDPMFPEIVWACISSTDMSPDNTNGVARINITAALTTTETDESVLQFYDLSHLANPATGAMAVLNDLTFEPKGKYAFISDTWGYQLLRLNVATGESVVWNNGSAFCTDCLQSQPHYDGPNGIEYYDSTRATTSATATVAAATSATTTTSATSSATSSATATSATSTVATSAATDDFLLVALGSSSKRLLKVSAVTAFQPPTEVIITASINNSNNSNNSNNNSNNSSSSTSDKQIEIQLADMDAIIFDPFDQNIMFVCGNGVNAIYVLNTTIIISSSSSSGGGTYSSDSSNDSEIWATAELTAVLDANCPQQQPSAIAIVQQQQLLFSNNDSNNNNNSSSSTEYAVVAYCTNGFGPAPYPLTAAVFPR